MTVLQAFKKLAGYIWKYGERLDGSGCLIPTECAEIIGCKDNVFCELSDVLARKYNATHYSCKWQQHGKSVLIELYACEFFGASQEKGTLVESKTVNI